MSLERFSEFRDRLSSLVRRSVSFRWSRAFVGVIFVGFVSTVSLNPAGHAWGPAAFAQDVEGSAAAAKNFEPVTKPDLTAKKAAAIEKRAAGKVIRDTAKKAAGKSAKADNEGGGNENDENAPESVVGEERDPIKIQANSRELAVRVVGISKISVLPSARKYIPQDFENRLAERLIQDLAAKTYFEPQPIDGVYDLKSRASVISDAIKKASADGLLVFQIGIEKVQGYLAASSGRRIRTFDFKFKIGELEDKNAVSVITDRVVEGIVGAIPYRGFVTATDNGSATVNLGTAHGIKEGDKLELFEFRRPNFNATHKVLMEVQVKKVNGPSESIVEPVNGKNARIEPFSKVSFSLSKNSAVAATDHSVVSGKWWFGFGGELNSFSAEAAAPKYESRVFKINGAPFGYAAGGNDVYTFRGAFGSGRSDVETLSFFDFQTTYALYQFGGAQSAWSMGVGGRVFMVTVTPNPGVTSALESTMLVSPMAELKYQYVPRGRIQLHGIVEVFWPIYTTGAQAGALIFAFGAGAGGGMQIAITNKFGVEVFGKLRYLRRPIDGQSGVQERQSVLGAGLIFSF